jgi:FAD synthase
LRDEAHYPNLETLTAQIERDARDARRYFETALHD